MEDIKNYCKEWFEKEGVTPPKTARGWKGVGVSIPPRTSLTALKTLGLKPADIINYIYGKGTAKVNKKHELSYQDLGLVLVRKEPTGTSHTTVYYTCTNCSREDHTDQGTLVRWQEKGVKFCSSCRGSSGKVKTLEYYQGLVGARFLILERKDQNHLTLRCLDCSTEFTRSVAQVTQKETDTVCCPSCYKDALYIKGKAGSYDSLIEKELTEHIEGLAEFQIQVPYSSFLQTDRKFIADIYLYNTVIEITTKSNKLPGYTDRLAEKKSLCTANDVAFHVVHSKQEIEDIVRSLLKDKEN